jgi:hypothetical protein
VLALVADPAVEAALRAGFEEEGVPLECELAIGEPHALGRIAARRSALGLGVGCGRARVVLTLAAAPSRPYLEAPPDRAREFAQAAARIAAGRPLRPT